MTKTRSDEMTNEELEQWRDAFAEETGFRPAIGGPENWSSGTGPKPDWVRRAEERDRRAKHTADVVTFLLRPAKYVAGRVAGWIVR